MNIFPFHFISFGIRSGAIHVWNEQSVDLFLGYASTAAIYVGEQRVATADWRLERMGIMPAGNNTMWEELVPFCVGAGKSSSGNEIRFILVCFVLLLPCHGAEEEKKQGNLLTIGNNISVL